MKIGINAQDLEGKRTGVGFYLLNLLKNWHSRQGEFEFILYFKDSVPADIGEMGFECRVLEPPLGWGSNALYKHLGLTRAAKEDGIDILFCPDYILPLMYNGKTAVTIHDIVYEARPGEYSWPSWKDRILLKWASGKSAKKADLILTPSEFSKREIEKYYRINPEKVAVAPLAAEKEFRVIEDEAALKKIKQKFGIRNKFIFFVGSVVKRRHINEAVKGFLRATEGSDYQFLIGGKEIDKIDAEFHDDKIIKIDYLEREDLPLLFNAAELFVWLSSYEGFSLPPLESISCGTPVVACPYASVPEVLGDCAIYVTDPRDTDEIAAAFRLGLNDAELRAKLSAEGLKRAGLFSWEKCAGQTMEAIKNFL